MDGLFHPFTSIAKRRETGPWPIASARGARIRDRDGREYIDAMAGLWCVSVGYGREELARAMADQARELSYFHTFLGTTNDPAERLATRLVELGPGTAKVFFANSGSEANETAIKLVWLYNHLRDRPAKRKLVARRKGYHGVTLGGASLSGLPHLHAGFGIPLPGFLHVSTPHHYREAEPGESERELSERLARELDEVIRAEGPDTVAAFVAEPVIAAGGVIPPPVGYFEAIQAVLREHDVLLVADEVVCGFGRLGAMWGSEVLGMEPDLVCAAKGLTSAYFPLSATLVGERVWEVLESGSEEHGMVGHGHTTSGHPIGAAVALANLDVIEGEGLVAHAGRVGARLQERLRCAVADHPLVGEVRGLGLIAGVELVPTGTRGPRSTPPSGSGCGSSSTSGERRASSCGPWATRSPSPRPW